MNKYVICGVMVLGFSASPWCLAQPDTSNSAQTDISSYLVDITSGSISAGQLAGISSSAITQIETSQDIVVALKPIAMGNQKGGIGFAITPARTTLTPMSGKNYAGNNFMRLLGALTLSYAESDTITGTPSYKKSAVSLDTTFYLNRDEDPVVNASNAFAECHSTELETIQKEQDELRNMPSGQEFDKKLADITARKADVYKKCIDTSLSKLKDARWNSDRFNLSLGRGWALPDSGNIGSLSLGNSTTLNAQRGVGEQGAINISLRRTVNALDTSTIGTTPTYNNSNLAAARYTYGSKANGSTKILIEASNSRSTNQNAFKEVFIYAIGVDKKIFNGGWLEFRMGRNRSLLDNSEQTAAMLNLNIAPSSTLFAPK